MGRDGTAILRELHLKSNQLQIEVIKKAAPSPHFIFKTLSIEPTGIRNMTSRTILSQPLSLDNIGFVGDIQIISTYV